MKRRYRTVDVFTDTMFGGNPLAVVLDAADLATAQMQLLAAEFGYSETTFVLPPRHADHTAQVRIFSPRSELPFAGHPNVGTAFVLAGLQARPPEAMVFEEAAGLVPMTILQAGGRVSGAIVTAPQPLRLGGDLDLAAIAAALSLREGDLRIDRHRPMVASVGAPFVFVELASRAALAQAAPDLAVHRALLPFDGANGIYAYVRDGDERLHARVFAPIDGIAEDPATGSATAAVAALIAQLDGRQTLSLQAHQGVELGRPSLLLAQARRLHGGVVADVGGACVAVMDGIVAL